MLIRGNKEQCNVTLKFHFKLESTKLIFLFDYIPEGEDADPEVSRDEGLDDEAQDDRDIKPPKSQQAYPTNSQVKGYQNQEGQEEGRIPFHGSTKQASSNQDICNTNDETSKNKIINIMTAKAINDDNLSTTTILLMAWLVLCLL